MAKRIKKLQLVEDWKQSWKFLSVQLASALVVLQLLQENMPALQPYLPEGWVKYIGLAIVIGRIVQQGNVTPVKSADQSEEDSGK